MGRRCGCVGKECNCQIRPGRGVGLSGEGNQSVPLVVTQSAPAYLRAGSTNETDVVVDGTGTVDDPYNLSIAFVGVAESKPLSIIDFETPGTHTWTRPVGCTLIEVTVIGGGAGGNAGANPPGVGAGIGGFGGQGGGWTKKVVALPGYVTDCTVVVGNGGSGATAAGSQGGYGGDSYLRVNSNPYMWVYAKGGGPGSTSGWSTQGGALHSGVTGPVTVTDARRDVYTPAGAGGGKGANGNEDTDGAVPGGFHWGYDGTSWGTMLGFGGDGGRGGRAFTSGALAASGFGLGGSIPGGGGGGGRGAGNSIEMAGGTWTFGVGAGGAGARGLVRVVAY